MHTFNITQLAGSEVLVEGTSPKGEHAVTLNSSQWEMILDREREDVAEADFDQAVKDFFAPLTEASTKYQEDTLPLVDSAFFYVLKEGQSEVKGEPAVIIDLETDTVILRLLNRGDTDRLRWARIGGEDKILIIDEHQPKHLAETGQVPSLDEVLEDLVPADTAVTVVVQDETGEVSEDFEATVKADPGALF